MTRANKCAHKSHNCKHKPKLYLSHGLHHPALPEPLKPPPHTPPLPCCLQRDCTASFSATNITDVTPVPVSGTCTFPVTRSSCSQLGALRVEGGKKGNRWKKNGKCLTIGIKFKWLAAVGRKFNINGKTRRSFFNSTNKQTVNAGTICWVWDEFPISWISELGLDGLLGSSAGSAGFSQVKFHNPGDTGGFYTW